MLWAMPMSSRSEKGDSCVSRPHTAVRMTLTMGKVMLPESSLATRSLQDSDVTASSRPSVCSSHPSSLLFAVLLGLGGTRKGRPQSRGAAVWPRGSWGLVHSRKCL